MFLSPEKKLKSLRYKNNPGGFLIRPQHRQLWLVFVFGVVCSAFFLFNCHSADAATRTWKGSSASNKWNLATNWNEGVVPVAGDDLVFPTPRVTYPSASNDIAADTSFNSITINASGYTLAGNRITLAGAFTDNSASSTNAVSLAIILNSTQTFSVASGVTTTLSGIISGAGGVTKSGSGTLKLSGANIYQGLTTVDAGILLSAHNTGLGTTDAATTVTDGAQLVLNGSLTVTEALTINGTGISGTGALRNSTGTSTWSGAITLGSAAQIQTDGSMGLTVSGGISGTNTDLTLTCTGSISSGGMTVSTGIIALGTGQLIKTGAGKVTTSTANTYTGDTTILNGYLILGAAAPSGSAGTLGNSTNAVILGDSAAGGSAVAGLLTSAAVTVARNITVVAGSSGKTWIGGHSGSASTFSGTVTLNKDVYLTAYSGITTTFSGVISGDYNVIIDSPTTSNSGYVRLSNSANTYTGDTSVVANAMLDIGAAAPSGSAGALGNSSNAVVLCPTTGTIATTVYISGAYTVARGFTVRAGSSGVMTFNGANSAIFSGNIALNKAATLISATGATVTFSGVISGDFALTLTPGSTTGIIVLSNTNTYTGGTTVNGTAQSGKYVSITNNSALGTGAVTVVNTGCIRLSGDITVSNTITLNGPGSSNANSGVLYNTSGTNYWSGAITVASAISINSSAGTLTLTGGMTGTNTNLTFNGSGTTTISTNGFSIGSGTLTVNGIVVLNAANTYTGVTTVSAGNNNLTIGIAAALGSTPSVATGGAAKVTLTGGIDVGNIPLTLNTGSLINDSGNNSWAGAVTYTAGYPIKSNADTLTLTGGITGTNANITFDGAGNITINTVGITTGTGTIRKDGAGKLTIAAASTYSGAIALNVGTLNLQNDTASGTTAGGITVASGAALELQGGIAVGAEALTINNTGVSSGGSLRNISGNNSYAGAITLATNAVRINSDADTLTLTGGISGSINLTVGGSGNVTIGTSGYNSGGAQTLTKDGTGKLTISASGNYTGLTTVSAGVLNVQHATATGTTAGGVTVTAGAAVQIEGGITVGAEALTLNGTGVSADGVLRNISGNNTWQGNISLGSDVRINSDADLLTLSGTTGGNTMDILAGGAGNITISGIIGTTTGTLGKDGAGNLILSAANTFTGLTTITAGTLTYGINDALKSGNSATIVSGAILDLVGYNATSTDIDNSGTFKLHGGQTVSGTLTNQNNSLVQYYGTSGPYTLKNCTYYNLQLASASATTHNLPANLTINGTLTINADNTLDAVSGSNYNINIKGNWANAGSFTAQNGTVTFDGTGAQSISGPTTFYGLAITGGDRTVSFESTVAQSIAAGGYLTLTGTADHLLTLAPLTGASAWLLQVSTTNPHQSISYVSVSYSDASDYQQIDASDGTNFDGDHNTNWSFGGNAAPTLSIAQPDGSSDTIAQNASYNITYTLADSDNVVTAAFYYDNNASLPYLGQIMGACETAAEGAGVTCSWDTTDVSPGSYYVYGITNDGVNPQVSAYSSGTLTINAAPAFSIFQPDGVSDLIAPNASFEISYSLVDADSAVTVALYYDSNGSGLDGTEISGGCATGAEGEVAMCDWDTTDVPSGSYYIYGKTSDGINSEVSAYSMGPITINAAPTISIAQPDGSSDMIAQNSSYNIEYTLADSDNVVTAAFYYDSNASGLDGVAITGACATAAEGNSTTCSWDTTGITPGAYYVYGIVNDGVNGAVSAYSSGTLTINAAPTLSIAQPNGSGDTVTVGDAYDVTYSLADADNVVTSAFYYDSSDAGLDGVAIAGACATAAEGNNTTCSWDTTGMTPGEYYVYGLTDDGVNSEVSAYSSGVITIESAGSLVVGIIDEDNATVPSPSIAMSTTSFSFLYQSVYGTLGIPTQKIRIENTTANPQWSVTIAATDGQSALWSAGAFKYDYNDPGPDATDGSDNDTYGGQLAIDALTSGVLTPKSGCANTGLTLGSSGAFNDNATTSITILSANSNATAATCFWDLTGVDVDQTIPREQKDANYSINLTMTILAN